MRRKITPQPSTSSQKGRIGETERSRYLLNRIHEDSAQYAVAQAFLATLPTETHAVPAKETLQELPVETQPQEIPVTPPRPSLKTVEALIQQGDTAAATVELDAFASDPNRPQDDRTRYEIGYLYLHLGEKEKASKHLRTVGENSLFYEAAQVFLNPRPFPEEIAVIDITQPEVSVPRHPVEQRVRDLAGKHQIELILALALIKQESDMNPRIVSHAGAAGLCQIMPATGRDLNLKIPHYRDITKPTIDPAIDERFHPYKAMDAGFRYLRQLLNRYDGNVPLALSAYNAGMGRTSHRVARIRETVTYVADVMTHYWRYQDDAEAQKAMTRLVAGIEAVTN